MTQTRQHRIPIAAIALTSIAIALFTSCSSKPTQYTGPIETFQQEGGFAGFGGEHVVDTTTTNATVVALDPAHRIITLKFPDGRLTPYRAGPEVSNFDALKPGDEVQTTVSDQMAISMAPAGAPLSATNNAAVIRGPAGTSVVETQILTGKVLAVDSLGRWITLQLANGQTRTVKVMSMINVADFGQGNEVTMRVTEARTFVIEKQ
jgi:hypothetical protein